MHFVADRCRHFVGIGAEPTEVSCKLINFVSTGLQLKLVRTNNPILTTFPVRILDCSSNVNEQMFPYLQTALLPLPNAACAPLAWLHRAGRLVRVGL